MKRPSIQLLFALLLISDLSFAQKTTSSVEKFGNTLNLGAGLAYYGYLGHPVPVIHADYEFSIARSFTLAPSISFYTFQDNYYWGAPHYSYRYYSYRETVIPVGVKGSYYFDKLLNLNPKWDIYLAASMGFVIRNIVWENGYYGDKTVNPGPGDLFFGFHIGSEYHLNKKAGLFLDLSTGVSTFGLALHL